MRAGTLTPMEELYGMDDWKYLIKLKLSVHVNDGFHAKFESNDGEITIVLEHDFHDPDRVRQILGATRAEELDTKNAGSDFDKSTK